jgi:NAD-dependent SIR2 family protein deacetylase
MKSKAKKCKERKERAEPPFPLVNAKKSSRNYRDAFAAVAKLLEGRKNVLVLAGAGISVSCGIPDFRSRGSGLYSMLDTEVSERRKKVTVNRLFSSNLTHSSFLGTWLVMSRRLV